MSLKFSKLHLIVDSNVPTLQQLQTIFGAPTRNFSQGKTEYIIDSNIENDNYFWLYAKYGATHPHSPVIFDIQKEAEEQNPRSDVQLEPNNQLFALYCKAEKVLYLSNATKKELLEYYFSQTVKKPVTIKRFFQNYEEFIERIAQIKSIKLVAKPDLFSSRSGVMSILPNPADLYGLGIAARFKIESTFEGVSPTDKFKEIFSRVVKWKTEEMLESLVCVGKDDKGFETVYNVDAFTQKIEIPAKKTQDGMYEPDTIRDNLINYLKRN